MSVKFSVEQFATLDDHRNWVVSTGAGAGKTTLLVERYLHLLIEHPKLDPSSVLALTFSQKAAEEMRARVYRGLVSRLKTAQGGERERLLDLKAGFQDCSISTLHSFCFKMLQSHPLEAGLDPNIKLMTNFDRRRMLREAYESVFKIYARKPVSGPNSEENSIFLKMLGVWSDYSIRNQVHSLLEKPEHYRSFVKHFLLFSKDPEKFMGHLKKTIDQQVRVHFSNEVKTQKIQSLLDQPDVDPILLDLATQTMDMLKALQEGGTLENLHKKCLEILEHEAIAEKKRQKGLITAVAIRDWINESGIQEFSLSREWLAMEALGFLIRFANDVKDAYEKDCRETNVLDFDRLQSLTLQLFLTQPNVLAECRDHFRYILVDEFQDTDALQWQLIQLLSGRGDGTLHDDRLFIVGDEKQAIYGFRGGDVRVFRKARAMIEETANRANKKDTPLFFEKKNDAERNSRSLTYYKMWQDLPREKQERIRNGQAMFQDNFRSHPKILEFVNAFFSKLFEEKNEFDPEYEPLLPARKRGEDSDDISRVTLLAVDAGSAQDQGEEPEEEDDSGVPDRDLMREARHMVGYLRGLLAEKDGFKGQIARTYQTDGPTIGILFRRFTKIKIYEEMLRQEGLDFFVHKGQGFFRRQEVYDIYNMLEFLNDPRKDIALIGLLRTAVFGLTDGDLLQLTKGQEHATFFRKLGASPEERHQTIFKQLNHFLQLKDRLRLSELLQRIVFETSWNVAFGLGQRGNQKLFNVNKLIEMARNFEAYGLRGLSEFCQFLKDQIDQDEKEGEAPLDLKQGSGIILMTVHQSKGLEFPVVVVPDLRAKILQDRQEVLGEIDGEGNYFYGIRIPDPERNYERKKTFAFEIISRIEKEKRMSEAKRLFYVACTRAKEHLVLVGVKGDKKKRSESNDDGNALGNTVWSWLDHQLDVQPGVNEAGIKESQAGPIRVAWYQSSGALFKEIPYHPLPEHIPRVEDLRGYQIHVSPLREKMHLKVTPTQLSTFDQCSRKFFYRNILKLPEFLGLGRLAGGSPLEDELTEILPQDMFDEKTDYTRHLAAVKGNLIHAFLEMAQGENENRIDGLIEKFSLEEGIALADLATVKDHIKKVVGDVTLKNLLKNDRGQSVAEASFDVMIEGVQLQGTIDRLYWDAKIKQWVIVDFKTNRIATNATPAKVAALVRDNGYDLQVNAYALAAEKILNQSVDRLLLYFTDPTLPAAASAFEVKKDFAKVHSFLASMHGMMVESEIEPKSLKPKSLKQCERCGYLKYGVCHYPTEG